jgi:hypothetical protein
VFEGISTNRNCEAGAECLRASGKQFVVRYHSRTTQQPQKRLSPREAAMLARADLDLVTVYQDRARAPEDFGRERGVQDGRSAFAFASQVGQPPGSAVYFAVDEDFSSAQIEAVVLPYFEGVRAGMDDAAGGLSAYRIGVYGSGLCCTRVRDVHGLAQLAWLAQSTGWRGSAGFDTWNIRQHVTAEPLCGLPAEGWERNEARADFGQFRPIGAEVTAGEGALMRVTAPELFLRRMPATQGNVPIARMREGQIVHVLGQAVAPWLRVRANIDGGEAIGFASARFLAPADGLDEDAGAAVAAGVAAAGSLPVVHFREDDPQSRRSSTSKRAQPLGEPDRPGRDLAADSAAQATQLGVIVDWLASEQSARYQRTELTFCNIYAADYCYLAGAYLPRVWWTDDALRRIGAGETPPVRYGVTVREMRADDLLGWLIRCGPAFGWRRVFDGSALQATANGGGIGLICADRAAHRAQGTSRPWYRKPTRRRRSVTPTATCKARCKVRPGPRTSVDARPATGGTTPSTPTGRSSCTTEQGWPHRHLVVCCDLGQRDCCAALGQIRAAIRACCAPYRARRWRHQLPASRRHPMRWRKPMPWSIPLAPAATRCSAADWPACPWPRSWPTPTGPQPALQWS